MSVTIDVSDAQLSEMKEFLTESYLLVFKDNSVTFARIVYLSMIVTEKYGSSISKIGRLKLTSQQKLSLCVAFVTVVIDFLSAKGKITSLDAQNYKDYVKEGEQVINMIESIMTSLQIPDLINKDTLNELKGKCCSCFRFPCLKKK